MARIRAASSPVPLGGYFSPQVFVNQIPRLALSYTMDEERDLSFAAGPAIQYIDEATQASVMRMAERACRLYHAPLEALARQSDD